MNKLITRLKKIERDLKGKSLEIGFFETSTYPSGEKVAQVAFWNQYGTTQLPPRPFFDVFLKNVKPDLAKNLGTLIKKNKGNVELSIKQLGAILEGELKQAIADFNSPRNADSKIKSKGFDNPLVDTGLMIDSVMSEVVES